MMTHVTAMMSNPHELPLYAEQVKQQAGHYREVQSALRGEPMRMLRLDRRSNMVLSVAVPIQDVRLVRGALLVSIGGGKIEKELADVHIVFLELFIAVLLVTYRSQCLFSTVHNDADNAVSQCGRKPST
jgi:two-component system sensor histidine kinase ChvG